MVWVVAATGEGSSSLTRESPAAVGVRLSWAAAKPMTARTPWPSLTLASGPASRKLKDAACADAAMAGVLAERPRARPVIIAADEAAPKPVAPAMGDESSTGLVAPHAQLPPRPKLPLVKLPLAAGGPASARAGALLKKAGGVAFTMAAAAAARVSPSAPGARRASGGTAWASPRVLAAAPGNG